MSVRWASRYLFVSVGNTQTSKLPTRKRVVFWCQRTGAPFLGVGCRSSNTGEASIGCNRVFVIPFSCLVDVLNAPQTPRRHEGAREASGTRGRYAPITGSQRVPYIYNSIESGGQRSDCPGRCP